jgi:hypothetical protein
LLGHRFAIDSVACQKEPIEKMQCTWVEDSRRFPGVNEKSLAIPAEPEAVDRTHGLVRMNVNEILRAE